MSLDPARANSPASSDSSLPRSRIRGNEESLKKDKNYRRYAATVERALSLFDTVLQEWADYISFLSRLLKALQSHPPEFPMVPHKMLVAKRLAQCLNPSLPSGVHQKALEVYTYIFSLIEPEGLSHDLPLYFPGIAPVLTFASLTVRPLLISLIETYLPQTEPVAIRPAFKAIILALLPGLEEETSDDFEPTLRTINKFRDVASQMDTRRPSVDVSSGGQYFWQCLFLASITNPSRRLGVLAYLNRHLPKLGFTDSKMARSEKEEQPDINADFMAVADSVISPEPGLLIRCFASGLADDQLLVQRNFLDLLVTHLPLHSPILQSRITKDDFERLVIAAAGVVTRRDMSLNRRLWTWFLGPEPVSTAGEQPHIESAKPGAEKANLPVTDSHEHPQSQYFSKFGLDPLVRGILRMITQEFNAPSERSRPFRIALSLMDRWEVGGFVVPAVFLPIMRSVQAFETVAPKSQFDELFKSASAFFDGVESSLIFSELLHLIDADLDNADMHAENYLDNLKLAYFILANFNVREEEMLLIHVPLLILSILVKTGQAVSQLSSNPRGATVQQLVKLLNFLVGLLPERAFLIKEKSAAIQSSTDATQPEILNKIHYFYDQSKEGLDLPPLPFTPRAAGELLLREAHCLSMSALQTTDSILSIKEMLNVFIVLSKKTPKNPILRNSFLLSAFHERLDFDDIDLDTATFSTVSSITSAATTLYNVHITGYYITYEQLNDLLPVLVRHLWAFLSSKSPKFHVEAVRSLWLLHSVSWKDHLVEASVTSLMIGPMSSRPHHVTSAENTERFMVLWNHSHHWTYESSTMRIVEEQALNGKTSEQGRSLYQISLLERPLFIILDSLSQDTHEASQMARDWIQDLPSIQKVLYIVVSKLEDVFTRGAEYTQADGSYGSVSPDDLRECQYLLQTLSKIISSLSHSGWVIFVTYPVSPVEKPQDSASYEDIVEHKTFQTTVAEISLAVFNSRTPTKTELDTEEAMLQRTALLVLRQLIMGIGAERIVESEIHIILIEKLFVALEQKSHTVQSSIIDTLLAALKIRFAQALQPPPHPNSKHRRTGSRDTIMSTSLLSLSSEKVDKVQQVPLTPQLPPQLLDCLLKGISSPNSRGALDKWILLLCESLPLYSGGIFQILLTLVEAFCKEIQSSSNNLQEVFKKTENWSKDCSEYVTMALLTGLETCIATAHDRLRVEEVHTPAVRSPDQPQGFFGNMVSNVFTSEGPGRNSANNRLTVLLCFQDAVRLCFSIWSWGAISKGGTFLDSESAASFQYTSLRMRNRSRRLLEHLFTAEALECLETLVEMWSKSGPFETGTTTHIFHLLHTLDGARPKITIPAIFNAIYSRTNPSALDPNRKSAMTSNISESELAAFLVTYARSLDDDVLDEIWSDCTTFLKDVLANPFPHRQILSRLIEFAAILGAKMENTSFGEDRRMRKELGDLLLRLLAAIFTSKPLGIAQESGLSGRPSSDSEGSPTLHAGPDDMLSILAISLPAFIITLGESDRINNAVTSISTNVIAPMFRSRLFPNNVNKNVLALLQQISKIPAASKTWRKDISDAFNDARFFGSHIDLVKTGWMSLLHQWVLVDKERMPELLSRLTSPTSAGIMFGVGASAARLEADRKAQLNLRRIALLILSASDDAFVTDLSGLLQKLEDLLTATNVSSPSSATRAEIFMVLRSIVLKTSTTQLAPSWPLINTELQEALCAVPQYRQFELYNPYSLLQACKLLDTLLLMAPDDFQLQEWLFVTDTIDAVYPPGRWEPVALADEVSQSLGPRDATSPVPGDLNDGHGMKRPWLCSDHIRETAKDEVVDRVLKPFFDRLSIYAFESTYSMSVPDLEACSDDLLADIFNESTMAS